MADLTRRELVGAGRSEAYPHITYAQLSAKGSPETVFEPKSSMKTLAEFCVARGSTDVEIP